MLKEVQHTKFLDTALFCDNELYHCVTPGHSLIAFGNKFHCWEILLKLKIMTGGHMNFVLYKRPSTMQISDF